MALSSTVNRNTYQGNGAVAAYSYTFRIDNQAHIRVVVIDRDPTRATYNLPQVLTLTTHFTVSGVAKSAGGEVTLVNGAFDWIDGGFLKDDYDIIIRRVVPLKQQTNIRNAGTSFFPDVHEFAYDYGVMIGQQQQDELDRCVKLPEDILSSTFDPVLPEDIADHAEESLIVNTAGDGWDFGISVSSARVFGFDTFAALKAAAAASPTQMRMGFATDIVAWVFYVGDVTIGDGGWIVGPGAGTAPQGGGLI